MLQAGRMDSRSQHDPSDIDVTREMLRAAGARELPRAPWQHPAEPPEASSLLRLALQRANAAAGHASASELTAALSLIETARSDLDTLEVALLLTARAEGLTWGQIARALGLRSPQAAQQRYQRISQRPVDTAVGPDSDRDRDSRRAHDSGRELESDSGTA